MPAVVVGNRVARVGRVWLIAALILGILLCEIPACAEESPDDGSEALDSLIEYAEEIGWDGARGFAEALLSGDTLDIEDWLQGLCRTVKERLMQILRELASRLMLPLFLCGILRFGLGGRISGGGIPMIACAACSGAVLMRMFTSASETVKMLLTSLARASGVLSSVLTGLCAVSGMTATSAVVAPLSGICVQLIEKVLQDVGFPICAFAAVVALAGSLSARLTLNRLFDLSRTALRGLLGVSVFAFTAMMSAQGVMTVARDTMALKAARAAIEGMVPVIGGGLSDSAGALSAGVGVIRSAVGVTGLSLIGFICLKPLTAIMAPVIALKIAAAVVEPVAEPVVVRLLGRFAEIHEMLAAICVASAVMTGSLCASAIAVAGFAA